MILKYRGFDGNWSFIGNVQMATTIPQMFEFGEVYSDLSYYKDEVRIADVELQKEDAERAFNRFVSELSREKEHPEVASVSYSNELNPFRNQYPCTAIRAYIKQSTADDEIVFIVINDIAYLLNDSGGTVERIFN